MKLTIRDDERNAVALATPAVAEGYCVVVDEDGEITFGRLGEGPPPKGVFTLLLNPADFTDLQQNYRTRS